LFQNLITVFKCSTIIKGKDSIEEVVEKLFFKLISVVSGKKTKAELFGHREFVIIRIGPSI